MNSNYDVVIIGAGAAGLMCAIEAGKRGRTVLVLDHAKKIGEKIRISGGGRCNFTNVNASPEAFISGNPHFCKSALKQFTQYDFIKLVEKYGITYHEKTLGQLFCNDSSKQIIDMLLRECDAAGATILQETTIDDISAKNGGGYALQTSKGTVDCGSLVIATGGLSIPKIGATKFGYNVAKQFGLNVLETTPALVPLTFSADMLEMCKALSGVSLPAVVSCGKTSFAEALLFTHRGLSGPSILQISSYWQLGEEIVINLAPSQDAFAFFKERKSSQPKQNIKTALSQILPNKLAHSLCELLGIDARIADLSDAKLKTLSNAVNAWHVKPTGTEGYRTAEVTLGGVDTNELSSKTMEAKKQPGLYFIGEVVDVTGHLGGYNFQWAWSSGYVAGQNV